jgi:hypothetical protein
MLLQRRERKMGTVLLVIAVIIAFSAIVAWIFKVTGIFSAISKVLFGGEYQGGFLGIFILALVGSAIGELTGWGFDFGPHPFEIYLIPVIALALVFMFLVPAFIIS